MSKNKIIIVAELGCNHNGDKNLAKQMIDAAKDCGVDAVKFQTFKSENLVSKFAPKAEYQKETTGSDDSQLEMLKKLELSKEDYLELIDYAKSIGLDAFSTPFDMDSIDFLASTNQKIWKIPAGEITNLPYLEKIGSLDIPDKKIIFSSGMSTIEEIKNCADVLIKSGTPKEDIVILHCNTEYPTPDKDVNISAIDHLIKTFPEHQIGFSDHSSGWVAPIAAATRNIVMIEKHFTTDKTLPGPDQMASADPADMKILCEGVRRAQVMTGGGQKIVTESEQKNKKVARKSIVAAKPIKKGELFSKDNLICKRPGNGISPMRWYDIIGKTAECDFDEDQLITATGFDWQE